MYNCLNDLIREFHASLDEKEILGQKLEGDTLLYCKDGKIERISLGQLK